MENMCLCSWNINVVLATMAIFRRLQGEEPLSSHIRSAIDVEPDLQDWITS